MTVFLFIQEKDLKDERYRAKVKNKAPSARTEGV